MSFRNPRIKITDSIMDVLMKMAGGNPGAISVLVQILEKGKRIDPKNAFEGFGLILLLDSFNIYEERIWMLYKDVCKEDIVKTVACLRGCQLGIISNIALSRKIDNEENTFTVNDLLEKVKERLPGFGEREQKCNAKIVNCG